MACARTAAVPGAPIALVLPTEESAAEAIHAATALGPKRVNSVDFEFAVDQLVEVAVRALSPGINDPHTAISVLNRLGAALCVVAALQLPTGVFFRDGRPALVVRDDARGTSIVRLRWHGEAGGLTPDGLDRVAHQHGFLGSALGPLWDLLPDYRFPGLDGDLSTIVAGLIGVALVAVVMLGLGRLLGGTTAPTGDDGPRPATSNGERPPTRDRPSTRPGLDRPDDGRTDG